MDSGDAADAADVHEFRGALANFRGKVAEMRENLVGSAMLIPIIGQNKQAAETRMMKISNGMLVVIPALLISGIVLLAGSRHLPREMALMLAKLRAIPSRRMPVNSAPGPRT